MNRKSIGCLLIYQCQITQNYDSRNKSGAITTAPSYATSNSYPNSWNILTIVENLGSFSDLKIL